MQAQGYFPFRLHLLGALEVWLGPRGVKSEMELFSFPALQKEVSRVGRLAVTSLYPQQLGEFLGVPASLKIPYPTLPVISLWDVSAHLSSPGPYLGLLTLCRRWVECLTPASVADSC